MTWLIIWLIILTRAQVGTFYVLVVYVGWFHTIYDEAGKRWLDDPDRG